MDFQNDIKKVPLAGETTNKLIPEGDKGESQEGSSPFLLDSEKNEIKIKVNIIKRELVGLSMWRAFHVLECVKEELSEQIETQSSNLIVLP